MGNRTRSIILCALFAALSAVLSQISIPLGPVPINLTHLSIFLAAGLLGAKRAVISQAVFVLLGVVGAPVFSGFAGGVGILLGPNGGFIVGYIGCALVAGWLMDHGARSMPGLLLAMYAGWVITYLLGILWFIYNTKTAFLAALPLCLFPFLPGDFLKTIVSAILVKRLRPMINRVGTR